MPPTRTSPTHTPRPPAPDAPPAPTRPSDRLKAWAGRESTGGILLLVATVAALAAANSGLGDSYAGLRDQVIGPAALHLDLSVGAWAADGLLALFFFVVGLELKREIVAGSLRDPVRALVPVAAAVGGVVVPVLVFLGVVTVLGADADALAGWAVPAATDIAFALAVLAVVGRSLPSAVRTFLLTLAVVDDLIAISIIAIGYTDGVRLELLVAAAAVVAAFALVVRRRPTWLLLVPLALLAWALVHASGVHATIAGVALGLVVPVLDGHDDGAGTGELAERAAHGPAASIEHRLAPWSACLAVPVFAFFAAGVDVDGLSGLADAATSPVAAGIVLALVVGKALGIVGATWLVTRVRNVRLDPSLRWSHIAGVSLLGGIGFTVSLLVGELAYGTGDALADQAKVGILLGSLVATVLAALVLRASGSRGRHVAQARVVRSE